MFEFCEQLCLFRKIADLAGTVRTLGDGLEGVLLALADNQKDLTKGTLANGLEDLILTEPLHSRYEYYYNKHPSPPFLTAFPLD
jgi:hypothetical protein